MVQKAVSLALIRGDINTFIPSVMKDERGAPMDQAEIHAQWHAHIDYCQAIKKYAIIMAPWGHGKTQQVVIARTLFALGANRNARIGIVCNSDDNAVKRVSAIADYVDRDEDYHEVFPWVRPDRGRGWGKQAFFVERTEGVHSVDPSVFAAGIFSTGIGGRMDMLIIDDPVDMRNALQMPALRPVVLAAITNVWLSRLEPSGMVVYIATAWHQDDATHQLIRSPDLNSQYCTLIQRINTDYTGIECYLVGSDPAVEYPVVAGTLE
ncbi:MAG: hypothetical protein ABIG68_11650 [Acidobacteriota bacterium]